MARRASEIRRRRRDEPKHGCVSQIQCRPGRLILGQVITIVLGGDSLHKHASDKFGLLRSYGFRLSQGQVLAAIATPDKTERRGAQTISRKVIDDKFALTVVHEERRHYSGDNFLSSQEEGTWPIG